MHTAKGAALLRSHVCCGAGGAESIWPDIAFLKVMQKNPRQLSGGSFPGCELETAAKEVVRELISVSGMQEDAREMLFMMQPMPLSTGKGFQLITQHRHPSDKLGIGKSYQQSSLFIYLKTTYKRKKTPRGAHPYQPSSPQHYY